MKRPLPASIITMLLMLCTSTSLWAQWEQIDPDHIDVDVTQLEVKPVTWSDVYPDMDGFGEAGDDPWLRITIEYTLEFRDGRERSYSDDSQWVDSMEFIWAVIIAPISNGNVYDDRRAVRLERTVTYRNIRIGKRKYYAVMFVEPRLLARYADRIKEEDIMTRLVIRVGNKTQEELAARGKRFATDSRDRNRLEAKGRRGNDIFESEDIIRPGFGLMTRLESPWRWSAYDSFETIQKAE